MTRKAFIKRQARKLMGATVVELPHTKYQVAVELARWNQKPMMLKVTHDQVLEEIRRART